MRRLRRWRPVSAGSRDRCGWVTPTACFSRICQTIAPCVGPKGLAYLCIARPRITRTDRREIATGRLIACSHRGRCLYRTEYDGQVTTLVDRHNGKRLNSPNDVVVKSDGSIWFTDPLYGISNDYEGGRQASEQPPAVYRFDPERGDIRIVADDFDGPNGLAFSPDESRLFVAETGDQTGRPSAPIYPRLRGGSRSVIALRRRYFSQSRAGLLRRHARRRGRQHLE